MNEKNVERGEWAPPSEKTPEADENTTLTNTGTKRYCSMCGTKVNSSACFCGNCGFNFNNYQNRTSEQNDLTNQTYQRPRHNVNNNASNDLQWKPILTGGIIAVGSSALLGFILGFFLLDISIYALLAMIVIINIVSLFIGGLYAGFKAKYSGGTHGALAGATCVLISIPINVLAGLPVAVGSIFFAILWGMLFAGIGGLIGKQIAKLGKSTYRTSTQPYYG